MQKPPAQKFRVGLVAATIWDNEGFYSVDVSRSYKGDDGDWKSTSSFKHSDLLNLAKCLERAESWIGKKIHSN